MHECNIVITNLGGPKEYYPTGLAQFANPYNTDAIGKAILKALDDNKSQPTLKKHIEETYNVSACTEKLLNYYSKILKYK